MDDIKFIINELNKEPFEKKLNIISYDSLRGEQRLEILFQIFKEIDPTINVESFQISDSEEVVIKILEMLRIFKYNPPNNMDPSTFRQNVILGERNTLNDILHYLLKKLPELKKRAYLSKFLVKIEVSSYLEGDNDIVTLYTQYEELIDQFKFIHNKYETLKKSVVSVQDLQKDLKSMEEEKDQVIQKLNTIKRKLDGNLNTELFESVKNYREEKEKNEKMIKQKEQQEAELQSINRNLNKTKNDLKDVENSIQNGSSPRQILEKMQEELNLKKHLINDSYPKEIDSLKKYFDNLNEIESHSSIEMEYLDKINHLVQSLNKEINEIVEKKMLNNDHINDKLNLFKQNAENVAKKKDSVQLKLNEAESELKRLNKELDLKKVDLDGDGILKGEALKEYVVLIKDRGNLYKEKRQELAELKTEINLLERTLEILVEKEKKFNETLNNLEEKRGISGYFSMREDGDMNNLLDENGKETNYEELVEKVKKLTELINEKKSQLAPIIKDLRPLRQTCQDLQVEYDKKKSNYDTCAAGLESNIANLESEVKKLNEECNELESQKFYLDCLHELLTIRENIVKKEMNYFVSTNAEDKSKSLQEKLLKEIETELENESNLRQKLKSLKENETYNKKQLKMWKDVQSLFEIKKKIFEKQVEIKNKSSNKIGKKDHLVL